MKFKRFSDRDQAFLRKADNHGLELALVIRAETKDSHHEVIGVAYCVEHLNTSDGEYDIICIHNLKGFDDEV